MILFRLPLLLALACTFPIGVVTAGTADLQLPERAAIGAVPVHELPADAVAAAVAQAGRVRQPLRFAVPVAVRTSLAQGLWDVPRAGVARWRLRLRSPGALTLSVHLSTVQLPAGAQLWIHGPAAEVVNGPYTAENVKPSGFWSPVVIGDQLVLELMVPAGAVARTQLEVAEAFHGLAPFAKAGVPGNSDSCNIDAACQAQTWGAEARSVAHITIGGQFFCSGQLVNNVQQDETPFFLTAWHCGINHGAGSADSVNFYFNYDAPCDGTAAAPSNPVVGSTLLADDEIADFALLRMHDAPPATAYFAGWNVTGAGAASGASIHHPSGDSKKISLFDSPVTRTSVDIGGGCLVDAWEVHWSAGTTEAGSSGAGLWSSSRQLIGVLSGGTASCGNPGGEDYYGRLDLAWTANASRNGQLKAHLDPAGTCIAAIPGLDPQTTSKPTPITSGPQRCEGETAVCRSSGGTALRGGGGSPGCLGWVLLLAALARQRVNSKR